MLFTRLFGMDDYMGDGDPSRKPTLPKRILPLIPAGLVVDQVLPSPDQIAIVVSPRPDVVHCPTCAQSPPASTITLNSAGQRGVTMPPGSGVNASIWASRAGLGLCGAGPASVVSLIDRLSEKQPAQP